MSIPLVVNGATFNYPVNFDEGWGIDATGWAQAVTAGMLQRAGGNFPLTADVNFGTSFGIIAEYYTSHSVNPSTVGTLRLASADPGIGFRNNANSGNLILTTDASDNLLYNGHIISPSSAGTVTSITGTANQVIASTPTGNVTLSLPQSIAPSSTPTFLGLTLTGASSLVAGTPSATNGSVTIYNSTNANYVQLAAGLTSASYTLKLPVNSGSGGQVLSTDGSGITSWINAAGGGTVNSGTQYQLGYYAANGAVISGDPNIITDVNGCIILVSSPTNTYLCPEPNATYLSNNLDHSLSVPNPAQSAAVIVLNSTTGASNVIIGAASAINLAPSNVAEFTTAGHTFMAPLAMSGNKITGLGTPTTSGDALSWGNPINGTTGTFAGAIDLGSNKITSVTPGTSPFDAATFSQIRTYGLINQAVSTTPFTNTLGTFVNTNSQVSITPTDSSHRIKITTSGTAVPTTSNEMFITIARNGTNIGPSSGFASAFGASGVEMPVSIVYIDSPATTSLTTYSVQIRGTGAVNTTYGITSQNQIITVEEIA